MPNSLGWPANVVSYNSLIRAIDNVTSQLSGDINTVANTLAFISSVNSFPPVGGVVLIDEEEILYGVNSSGFLSSFTRGFAGTDASSHGDGALIQLIGAAEYFTRIQDEIVAMQQGFGCRLDRTTVQSMPSGAWTAIQWENEIRDTGNLFQAASNTLIYVASGSARWLHVSARVTFYNVPGGGNRAFVLYRNGALYLYGEQMGASIAASGWGAALHFSDLISVTSGDRLELLFYQDSGVSLQTLVGSVYTTFGCVQVPM